MSNKDKIKHNNNLQVRVEKCESLDEGTFAFLNWMNCKSFFDEKYKKNPPLILKNIDFPNIKIISILDRCLKKDILVHIMDGVPLCKNCFTDDCSHVGFTICLLQLIEREGIESMEDLLK
jgi:hypothetical protein